MKPPQNELRSTTSNYAGKGKRIGGSDVTVSRGSAGEFMYDFDPIRHEADKILAQEPTTVVRFVCRINRMTVAGFCPRNSDGSVIEVEIGAAGFLTKPTRIWRIG